MNAKLSARCTAFEGFNRIDSGEVADVAVKAKAVIDRGERAPVLIFDDTTSELIEVDFRGTAEDVRRSLADTASESACAPASGDADKEPPRGPGRPRLGVVAREVTLLPRHWDWLNSQPGGASVTLRKLVDQARRANEGRDRVRQSQDAANRFMSAIAGDLPGFEEATRALFAVNPERFDECIASWPVDVRDHARKLATVAFQKQGGEPPVRIE